MAFLINIDSVKSLIQYISNSPDLKNPLYLQECHGVHYPLSNILVTHACSHVNKFTDEAFTFSFIMDSNYLF